YNQAPKPYNSTFDGFGYTTPQATNLVESGLCYADENGTIKSFDISGNNDLNKTNFEFDLYSFSFGGNSGKFIFKDKTTGVSLDRQNIIFKATTNRLDLSTALEAVTPDGTRYIFGLVGYTYTSQLQPVDTSQEPVRPPTKARTWYLTKIIYSDKTEVVFKYSDKRTSISTPSLDKTWQHITVPPGKQYPGATDVVTEVITCSKLESYYLDSVYFTNGKLKFRTSPREDLQEGLKLDAIELYDNDDHLVKKARFIYEYFEAYTSGYDWLSISETARIAPLRRSLYTNDYISNSKRDQYRSKRLKLKSVQVTDGTLNGTKIPAYSFTYNSITLPRKTSFAQDLWGFYNGADLNETLLPNYNKLGYWDGNIPDYFLVTDPTTRRVGNRSANEAKMAACALLKINYPTGGHTSIEYEANKILETQSSSILIDKTKNAVNVSSGVSVEEFEVPDIGFSMNLFIGGVMKYVKANPVSIHITLNCCPNPPDDPCPINNGYCVPYDANYPTKGLYTKLERWNNETGTWVRTNPGEQVYDFKTLEQHSNVQTFGSDNYKQLSYSTGLIPGRYRITANYPDNAPSQGGTGTNANIASISLTYKEKETDEIHSNRIVGGLRVQKIEEHNETGSLLLQKKFVYEHGKLMTQPIFYRKFSNHNFANDNSAHCSSNQADPNSFNCSSNESGCPSVPCQCDYVDVYQYTLYSNPVANYSYSAHGGLVGYNSVTISYDKDGKRGSSQYFYHNNPDSHSYEITVPGIPPSNDLLNGLISKQVEYNGNVPVKSVEYKYELSGFAIKWCFKTEYNPPWITALDGNVHPSSRFEPEHFYLHFYPLKLGKQNLQSKTETFHNTQQEKRDYVVTTTYEYNDRNQVTVLSTTDSKNQELITSNFYPQDYAHSQNVYEKMVEDNVITPVIKSETLNKTKAKKIKGQEHEFKVTPTGIYVPSLSKVWQKSGYEHEADYLYDDHGNLIQWQKDRDRPVSYLWGYQHTLPIAKVENATHDKIAFTSFESPDQGGWEYETDNVISGGVSGEQCLKGFGHIYKNNLPEGDYIISCKVKRIEEGQQGRISINDGEDFLINNSTTWKYIELPYQGGDFTLYYSQIHVDDLRLYPKEAQMESYTYTPLTGITSSTDPNGITSYYGYDPLDRLQTVKDHEEYILKQYIYHYQNKQ
ncbi:hypothetical protein, partial [Fulvivirga kasyanovii]